jgi:hypothetical protein
MKLQPVYMVCGVPGSGKTWVLNQLTDLFTLVRNDDHIENNKKTLFILSAAHTVKPVLTDCPFGERLERDALESVRLEVWPYFIVEPVHVVMQRYQKREGKPLPMASVTRASTIKNRAEEWGAPYGTSEVILDLLKKEGMRLGSAK